MGAADCSTTGFWVKMAQLVDASPRSGGVFPLSPHGPRSQLDQPVCLQLSLDPVKHTLNGDEVTP